jgi:hypothetical protein
MRRPALLTFAVLALAACSGEEPYPSRPPGGGGGGGGTGGGVDAAPGQPDAGQARIAGTVCQLADIRVPGLCTPREGVTVTRRGSTDTTVTAADGSFSLPGGAASTTVVLLASDQLRTIFPAAASLDLDADGSGAVTIPVVAQALMQSFYDINGLPSHPPEKGIVAVVVGDGQGPLENITLSSLGGVSPYYAVGSASTFAPTGPTDASGFAVWFDATPGDDQTFTTTKLNVPTTRHTIVVADALVYVSVAY